MIQPPILTQTVDIGIHNHELSIDQRTIFGGIITMDIRKHLIWFATFMLMASAAQAVTISATFDSDAQGWTGNPGQGSLAFAATGGNPGGHIRVTDIGIGTNNGFASGALAGSAFLGDLTAYDGGTFSLDMATFAGGGATFASFGRVVLFSGSATAEYDFAATAPARGGWQNYSMNFDASTFGVSQTDWLSILSNVTLLGISTDAFDGADTIGIDNVVLTSDMPPVPLPASLVLLAGALAGLGAFKRMRAS
jgi:hypothetical protein